MKLCSTCQRTFIDEQEFCPLDETPLDPSDAKPPPNLGRVLGSYRLISRLGEGGMGTIYMGAHTRLNRYVAIKVLRPELQNRKESIARFFDEARTVNKIKHPNIVESIDLVEDVVDGAYCVLELLHGPDLKALLQAGPIAVESAIYIGAQIADALSAVHAIDIVHRDLKPENLILIERGGRDDFVKLIDFGVAQISEEGATGIPFGTAAYMAPEQAAGERVDGRADVYSLGVLLFEMVTGRHPFPSNSDNEYLIRHADDEPPRPTKLDPRIPRDLEALILRCLAKKPEQRYPTAAAVAVALRAIELTPAKAATGKWVLGGLIIAAGVAAAAVLVVPGLLAHDPEPTATPTVAAAPRVVEPTPKPATPAQITIAFRSTPAGARVFRIGETVPLGVTPFDTTFALSDQPAHVRFELAGYRSAQADVALDSSHDATIELTKLPDPKPEPAAAARKGDKPVVTKPSTKPVQREGTMDPFSH